MVELGAGIGFIGLIASSLGADQVQMTDYTGTTLENLEYNLKLNLQWFKNQRRCNKSNIESEDIQFIFLPNSTY